MKTLNKKEVKKFLEENNFIKKSLIAKKDIISYDEKKQIYYINKKPIIILVKEKNEFENKFEQKTLRIPFLKEKELIDWDYFKSIIVDMPAVPYILKGADLLRPGIVEYESFKKDEIVLVKDEKNKVKLSVMKTLKYSEELKNIEKGRIAKNLHYFNDKYWKEN